MFIDAAKSTEIDGVVTENIKEAIKARDSKIKDGDRVVCFIQNLGIVNQVMNVHHPRERGTGKRIDVKDMMFADKVVRDRLKPQNFIFAEDRQPY